jgi:Spy/CpxP family protein refolding chaperone
MKLTMILSGALMAAVLSAVPAAAQRGPLGRGPGGPMMGLDGTRRLAHWATVLDLTEAQKAAAKTIFDNAKTQSEPIGPQLRDAHQAVQAAVKANKSDAEIETLTARSGALTGQLAAIHAKAQREFLKLLTAQQREKLDALHSQMRPRRGLRRQP